MDKKYEILPISSFNRICRTCLKHTELFLITEVSWEGIGLTEIIQDWTPLQLLNDKLLPQNMCKNCIKRMYLTYQFMLKCKSSERVLKNILFKESPKYTVDSSQLELIFIEDPKAEKIDVDADHKTDDNLPGGGNGDTDDFLDNKDNCSNIDDLAEVNSENSHIEEDTNSDSNILNKIDRIKNQISKIRIKNKARFQKMAKAQQVSLSDLHESNKRSSVFRKGPPYTCVSCDAVYQTHEELKIHKHETKHRSSLKFKCHYCHKRWETYLSYQEHVRTHTGEKPNKCPTCGRAFNGMTDLKRHMILHMEVKPYSCQICNKGFTRNQYLREHEVKHTGEKHTGEKFLCPFCGKGFNSYSGLSLHEKGHKGPPGCVQDPMTKNGLFQCHLCGKALVNGQTLNTHLLLHGPKNFTCEICGKTYISKNRLEGHIRTSHQGYQFLCKLCNKEYKQKSGLISHMRLHTGENNFPCDLCDKMFKCKGSLLQHKRLHTGDTKYQCKDCLQICTTKRNLETHMRGHTGEKPFACFICGKLFAQKANMFAHSKMHTGEKNHVCKLCDKAFYDTRGLRKHMKIHKKNG